MIIVLTQLTNKQKQEIINDIKNKIRDNKKVEFYKLSEVCALSSKYSFITSQIEDAMQEEIEMLASNDDVVSFEEHNAPY